MLFNKKEPTKPTDTKEDPEFEIDLYTYHNRVNGYAMRYTRSISVAIAMLNRNFINTEGISGIGFASCSILDLFDEDRAMDIASGRAIKEASIHGDDTIKLPLDTDISDYVAKLAERKVRVIDYRKAREEQRRKARSNDRPVNFDLTFGPEYKHLFQHLWVPRPSG